MVVEYQPGNGKMDAVMSVKIAELVLSGTCLYNPI